MNSKGGFFFPPVAPPAEAPSPAAGGCANRGASYSESFSRYIMRIFSTRYRVLDMEIDAVAASIQLGQFLCGGLGNISSRRAILHGVTLSLAPPRVLEWSMA